MTVSPPVSRSFTLARAVLAHLLPGLPLTAFTLAVAPVLAMWRLPLVWGLLIGVLVVQAPLLEILRRRLGPAPRLAPAAHPVLLTVAVTAACLLLPGAVAWVEPVLRRDVFGWVPTWWSLTPDATTSPTVTAVTVVLWIAAAVIVGPIVEERYFRGVLLSRLPGPAWSASLSGAALFALYHLWQPWAMVTVFAFVLPITLARTFFRLGIVGCCVAHCTVNAVLFAALLGGTFVR